MQINKKLKSGTSSKRIELGCLCTWEDLADTMAQCNQLDDLHLLQKIQNQHKSLNLIIHKYIYIFMGDSQESFLTEISHFPSLSLHISSLLFVNFYVPPRKKRSSTQYPQSLPRVRLLRNVFLCILQLRESMALESFSTHAFQGERY